LIAITVQHRNKLFALLLTHADTCTRKSGGVLAHLSRNDHVRHEPIGLLQFRRGRVKLCSDARQRVSVRHLHDHTREFHHAQLSVHSGRFKGEAVGAPPPLWIKFG